MANLLKDLYNIDYINIISNELLYVYDNFNSYDFKKKIFIKQWSEYELKQRMRHISTTLGIFLPKEYDKAINILMSVFNKITPKFSLENIIFQDFVEVHGLEHFDKSMEALECFTKGSSSEFAIRRYIMLYPQKTMHQMLLWANSSDMHVRRLASEGCRSRLPWAIALPEFKKNPQEVIKILEILKNDESEYVRKSVANNLNDISKDNPEILKSLTKRWIGYSSGLDWILKHGCRTLLKDRDKEVLNLFGFKKLENIQIEDILVSKKVLLGKDLEFSFVLNSDDHLGKLRVEFAIIFVRQNDKYLKKVFKISEGMYEQKSKKIMKKYSFKEISTRRYYTGLHKLQIIVNGEELIEKEFHLISS